MKVQVAALDVDDEGDRRLDGRNVRKVLLRSDTNVYAARLRNLDKLGNHELESGFIRQEVVGTEGSSGLGEICDESPELVIRQARRQVVGRREPRGRRHHAD